MTGPRDGGRFGPYRVLGVLGRGGMGQVLRAHDDEHQRDVALKVLHPQWAQDEGYRDRFRREARTAARLTEPVPADPPGNRRRVDAEGGPVPRGDLAFRRTNERTKGETVERPRRETGGP